MAYVLPADDVTGIISLSSGGWIGQALIDMSVCCICTHALEPGTLTSVLRVKLCTVVEKDCLCMQEGVLEGIQGAATALSYREYAKAHSRQPSIGAELAAELLKQQLDACSEVRMPCHRRLQRSAAESCCSMTDCILLRHRSMQLACRTMPCLHDQLHARS